MTIYYLKPHEACSSCEAEMPMAPSVVLPNGNRIVPQHYLQFEQTLTSLREIINDIESIALTPIFADQDTQGMYLQVGLIGRENYDRGQHSRPQKIVYGRKWRIDSDTPTSEIIQTVFLAIKKAREHEVRELLTMKDAATGKTSAPFSTHQDLPLMANNRDLLETLNSFQQDYSLTTIVNLLVQIRFGERKIYITDSVIRERNILLDIRLGRSPLARQHEGDMQEYDDWEFSVLLDSFNPSHFLYALMEKFIGQSDFLVSEEFSYKGFKRFNRDNSPARIASLSIASRPYERDMDNNEFAPRFRELNYQTDAGRVPRLGQGALADKNRKMIAGVPNLLGHMPMDLWDQRVETRFKA